MSRTGRFAAAGCLLAWAACVSAPYRPPEQPVRYQTHQVKSGDTLYSLAQTHGVSVEALMRLNRIEDPTELRVGERLLIPPGDRPQVLTSRSSGAVRSDPPSPRSPTPDPPDFRLPPPPPETCADGWDAPDQTPRSKAGYLWPVDGVVLARFGKKDGKPHPGLDIGAPYGSPVWASRSGVVVFAGEQAGFGRLLILEHDGRAFTLYGRNAEHCVREGERVRAGQLLARLGDQDGTGVPYLYFEVREAQRPVDPQPRLPP